MFLNSIQRTDQYKITLLIDDGAHVALIYCQFINEHLYDRDWSLTFLPLLFILFIYANTVIQCTGKILERNTSMLWNDDINLHQSVSWIEFRNTVSVYIRIVSMYLSIKILHGKTFPTRSLTTWFWSAWETSHQLQPLLSRF